jgi:hypothetical protein
MADYAYANPPYARCVNSTFTPTRQINVTSPTASNIAAAFARVFADLRKRVREGAQGADFP